MRKWSSGRRRYSPKVLEQSHIGSNPILRAFKINLLY